MAVGETSRHPSHATVRDSLSDRYILYLDDVQWADENSLSFLRVLFNYYDLRHVVVILSYRDKGQIDDLQNSRIQKTIEGIAIPQAEIHRMVNGGLFGRLYRNQSGWQ